MAQVASPSLIQQLGTLFEGGSAAGLSDRQLLERFIAGRDPAADAAFAAVVTRHGPMVLGICRQLLGDHHHAEDAFQATFLVLARQVRSIRDPDLLGAWLYGVALRTARKAKMQLNRRRKLEEDRAARCPEASTADPADQAAMAREQAETLHEEIDRLPSSFRLPVVLCYLEGLTPDEAARRLHCPAGTVHSRLVRARDKLRRGLTRRGVVLPAVTLTAALSHRSASASVSSLLCDMTTRSAIQFAAGQAVSPPATALAREVLRSMLFHKLKLSVLTLLFLGAVAAGAGFVGQAPVRQAGKPDLRQIAAKPDDANPKPALGRMFVTGRVLDPEGKPVPDASVMVYARSAALGRVHLDETSYPSEMGRTNSDGSGRFRIDAPRTSSVRHDQFGAVALAPGYGAGWAEFDPDANEPTADIALRPERVIQGRLFDLQGQPARDLKLSVTAIRRVLDQGPNAREEGPRFWWTHPDDLPGWPGPVTTGAEGRFTLRGVGPGLRVYLNFQDPRFASQNLVVETDAAANATPLSFALQPARTITGRVTYADTGKPVPHARVKIAGFDQNLDYVGVRAITSESDAEGRFRVNAGPGVSGAVEAVSPGGQPYLATVQEINWPKGAVAHTVDLALPRGVMIRGKITEQGSGRPVSGATVMYQPQQGLNNAIRYVVFPTETTADGSFAFPVVARPGYLAVREPSDDYVLQERGSGLLPGQSGGPRRYAHAFIACDPKPGGESLEVKIALRRGVTAKGHVIGPDGQSVPDAWMISRVNLDHSNGVERSWYGAARGIARNGRFELHGLDPDTEVPVYFLDPRRKLGATVRFSGKSAAGEPIAVRLGPCGMATARLVRPDGKPLGGFTQWRLIGMVVTPGPLASIKARNEGALIADYDIMTRIDPINYEKNPASDSQGRIVFPALVPGATYRIIDLTTARDPAGPQLRKEFTVKPGETFDLGDILIEKPKA